MNEHGTAANGRNVPASVEDKKPRHYRKRAQSRAARPRSAITSGRQLFIAGNPNSAWSRRFDDLLIAHINDISPQGVDALSAAQLGMIRQATSLECELERLQARLSCSETVDIKAFAQVASHLRRLWETLGLQRRAKDVTTPSVEDYLKHKNLELKNLELKNLEHKKHEAENITS